MGVLAMYSCDTNFDHENRNFEILWECWLCTVAIKLLQEEEHNNISGEVVSLINCLSLAMLNVSHNNLARDILTCDNFSKFSRQVNAYEAKSDGKCIFCK